MFTTVDAGAHNACAIRTDGTFACWGQNRSGQVQPRPTAALTMPANWVAETSVSLSWRATSLVAIASYDARYRRARWDGAFGPWTTWRTGTTATAATFRGSPGSTYCFEVRANDADGIVSPWTPEGCLAVPLDDRSLARSSGWMAGTGPAFYRSTFVRSFAHGARLTRTGVGRGDIVLVASRCPTCGSVRVSSGVRRSKVISLWAPVREDRSLIRLWTWTAPGTLTITVESSGKKVIIDGIAIRRR
jgi:hypothetical protein